MNGQWSLRAGCAPRKAKRSIPRPAPFCGVLIVVSTHGSRLINGVIAESVHVMTHIGKPAAFRTLSPGDITSGQPRICAWRPIPNRSGVHLDLRLDRACIHVFGSAADRGAEVRLHDIHSPLSFMTRCFPLFQRSHQDLNGNAVAGDAPLRCKGYSFLVIPLFLRGDGHGFNGKRTVTGSGDKPLVASVPTNGNWCRV